MRITIVQVAKDLNLAPSTVSKVLNNKGHISEATRKRVLDYVQEIGYIRDPSARALKSNRSNTLGILFSDIALTGLEHPFYSGVLQSFKNYCEMNNYEISFVVSKVGEHTMSYLEWCKIKKIDGVLIASGNFQNPLIVELVESDVPCVSTDFFRPKLPTIISDNEAGIDLALDHMIELNRHKISYISGPTSSIAFQQRLERFNKQTQTYEHKPQVIIANGFNHHAGYDATIELIKTKNIPEGIIVGSDDLAFGVIRALKANGIRVPEEVSVMGFDDVNFSEIYNPSLTTIHQDKKMIGETAAKHLISIIDEEIEKKQETIILPVKLIKRDSTTYKA